jgi:hypothetical protein
MYNIRVQAMMYLNLNINIIVLCNMRKNSIKVVFYVNTGLRGHCHIIVVNINLYYGCYGHNKIILPY